MCHKMERVRDLLCLLSTLGRSAEGRRGGDVVISYQLEDLVVAFL